MNKSYGMSQWRELFEKESCLFSFLDDGLGTVLPQRSHRENPRSRAQLPRYSPSFCSRSRWHRLFGIKGDGESDDRQAIQAALNAAAERGSETELATVRLSEGHYKLRSDLRIPSNVSLEGDHATLLGAGLSFTSVPHARVSGITVENASYAALSINACKDIDIAGISIGGFAAAEESSATKARVSADAYAVGNT